MLVKTNFFRFLFLVLILTAVVFTTCDSPMGMGDPIDWIPPELTLDPVSNPFYARLGSTLSGTATDNIGVEKIIFIDSRTGRELFPVIRNGNNWRINLQFSAEQNGEKIVGQVIAYDRAGNTDARSMAFITIQVDIRPPIIERVEILRKDTKELAELLRYSELKALEGTDRKDDLKKYQNGWFYIKGYVAENETKVKVIGLEIYDSSAPDTLLLAQSIDSDSTSNYPRWTIKEDDIINAGADKWGAQYKTNYYNNSARYYYRVVVKALDMSENESEVVSEDEGYICLWADSDRPKGILDPGVGTEVSKGTPFPVDLYDDDSIDWAYVGLFTDAQWNGTRPVFTGTNISGITDEAKLTWLKERLTGFRDDGTTVTKGTVYNWNFDKHNGMALTDTITNQITTSGSEDEKLVYVSTPNQDADVGDYVLFSLVADKKLSPHTALGPEWTNRNTWSGRAVRVRVKDENAPLIVFDTTATPPCPEENTFPKLYDTEYFDIVGYTLRESSGADNYVKTFRMAWIPFNVPGGPDSLINEVQNALRNNAGYPSGVQWWSYEVGGSGNTLDVTARVGVDASFNEVASGGAYKKQVFKKKFSVMGANDDKKPLTQNFTYNGLENETKLFIFYALDNIGHEVFRQLRLLGEKDKPEMFIYDITNREGISLPAGYPNPTATGNFTPQTGAPTDSYYVLLKTYNELTGVKAALNGVSVTNGLPPAGDEAESFKVYPRGTIVKYTVKAPQDGKTPIDTITMKDITYATNTSEYKNIGSGYDSAAKTFTFCEYYPDVTQRTFLFEAKDKLGNVKSIQRTIAVTNAARLESITTTAQNGIYGHGRTITILANFSSQIFVSKDNGDPITTEEERPLLNVRYKLKGSDNWVYNTVKCKGTPAELKSPSINLSFDFVVPEDAQGVLQTTFGGIDGTPAPSANQARPITLPSTTKIMDAAREGEAFIPGYTSGAVTMPNWTSGENALQAKKTITLDGVHPVAGTPVWGGKTAYSTNNYYFKTGETIELTIPADKPIRPSGASTLRYRIRDASGADRPSASTFYAFGEFKYLKPGDGDSLVYSLTVSGTNCPVDGEIIFVELEKGADEKYLIVDSAGNDIKPPANLIPGGTRIFIKKTAPVPPAATFGGVLFTTAPTNANTNYNTPTNLVIPASTSTGPGGIAWEDTIEYITNAGWQTYTAPVSVGANGSYTLQARYKDRAGNEGAAATKAIVMNNLFPNLVSVNAVQANGTYRAGSQLTFNLNFADNVRVTTQANVKITLKNRGSSGDEQELTTNMAAGASGTTITFDWNPVSGKQMWQGLYISSVTLTGLTDNYGNTGKTATGVYDDVNGSFSGDSTIASSKNLAKGLIVDAVAPTVSGRLPAHNVAPGKTASYTKITLTFDEPVMNGSGTITIKPKGNTYAIPPVLEDEGYYLGTDGKRYSSAAADRIYISSFYDIYNNSALTAAERQYLTKSNTNNSMSDLTLKTRTGQSAGPYMKMTHGLIEGPGYTGNYTNTTGSDGPNPDRTLSGTDYKYMIPDTATKWVLDYQYGIRDNNTTVNNIRATLTKAKWRWQEIDVVSTKITNTSSNGTVEIPLNEPLLDGLDWEVSYTEGTFTDMAGNPAPEANGSTTGDSTVLGKNYFFTSPGVQAPVIRVNRRSYDGRTANWNSSTYRTYGDPSATNTTSWNTTNPGVTDDNGWGITSFNYVHYRVESESPSAAITVKVHKGAVSTAGSGSATAELSTSNPGSSVSSTNGGDTVINAANWNDAEASQTGRWILRNIIHRGRNNTNGTYTVITKNGTPESRTSTGTFNMYRSYNRDLLKTDLLGTLPVVPPATGGTAGNYLNGQGFIQFNALEASKSYVVATATQNSSDPATGYEGVFRTVIALNYSSNRSATNFIAVEGSNVKNGMPSIAGFPVRDAEETGDNRFIKVFYNSTDRRSYYWVSTEIVCEWYFLSWGGGQGNNGTHQSEGEVNNYLTVGYGDLTYGYNVNRSAE